ncbi:MAG: hypothetical protein C0417_05720 [Chlorobiaceae bacterium]|nr:hypothetical protein [Chlorobiaceae bacterium]
MKNPKSKRNTGGKMKISRDKINDKSKILRRRIRTLEKEISKCEDQIKIMRIKLQRGIQDLSS